MRIEFSQFIEGDLEAIGDYIALDNPRRAVSFVREIRATVRMVGRQPLIYRLRPEIGKGRESRSWAGMSSCFASRVGSYE
jgi:plasmid stabilization system protein ParE